MRMSFGLPRPAELWASPARPCLQATAGPWDCPSHSSQPCLLLLWAPYLSLSWRQHSPQGRSSGFLTM